MAARQQHEAFPRALAGGETAVTGCLELGVLKRCCLLYAQHPTMVKTLEANRKDSVEGAGWEMLFIAIDDHSRLAFTAMHPDEKKDQAVAFLMSAIAYYAKLGVTVRRLLTDIAAACEPAEASNMLLRSTCASLGLTRSSEDAPSHNGKQQRGMARG